MLCQAAPKFSLGANVGSNVPGFWVVLMSAVAFGLMNRFFNNKNLLILTSSLWFYSSEVSSCELLTIWRDFSPKILSSLLE